MTGEDTQTWEERASTSDGRIRWWRPDIVYRGLRGNGVERRTAIPVCALLMVIGWMLNELHTERNRYRRQIEDHYQRERERVKREERWRMEAREEYRDER